MATLRESTSLLMAAEYGQGLSHSWAHVPLPSSSDDRPTPLVLARPATLASSSRSFQAKVLALSSLLLLCLIAITLLALQPAPKLRTSRKARTVHDAGVPLQQSLQQHHIGDVEGGREGRKEEGREGAMAMAAVELRVAYGGREVSGSAAVESGVMKEQPDVRVGGTPGKFYALVLHSSRGSGDAEPKNAQALHWIVLNIPSGSSADKGITILEYLQPLSLSEANFYTFTLYEQTHLLLSEGAFNNNNMGDLHYFLETRGLSVPVGALHLLVNGGSEIKLSR